MIGTPSDTSARPGARPNRFWFLKGRYLAGHLTLIVVVVSFVNLGFWQLRRLDDRKARNNAIELAQTATPTPIATATVATEWSVITATGTFDQSHEALVRARSLNGRPGYHVLTPLRMADGNAVIINRGWVPFTISAQRPDPSITPPGGTVTITGRLRPSQTRSNQPQTGDLNSADVIEVARRAGYTVHAGYLEQITPHTEQFPTVIPLPSLDEGPHFGYAMQWFMFSILAMIIWPLFVRKAARERHSGHGAATPASYAPGAAAEKLPS